MALLAESYQEYIGKPNIFDLNKLSVKIEREQDFLFTMRKNHPLREAQEKKVITLQRQFNKLRLNINHLDNRQIIKKGLR